MLQLGASVLLTARGAEELERVHKECSAQHEGRVHILAADVSEANGRAALVARIVELWGGALDILVNNVGTNKRQRVEDSTDEEYQQMVATNQDSAYFLCKLCLPLLRKSDRASVVNVSSLAGVRSSGTGVIYAMTKAAMVHMSKTLACEWGGRLGAGAPQVLVRVPAGRPGGGGGRRHRAALARRRMQCAPAQGLLCPPLPAKPGRVRAHRRLGGAGRRPERPRDAARA